MKLEKANTALCYAKGNIQAAKELVEETKTSLQEFYDSHSEKWQESDAALEVEEKIDNLDDVVSELDGANDELDNQIGAITEAMD